MKFKNLTDEQKKIILDAYNDKTGGPWEKRAAKLGETFNVSERTIRRWCVLKLNLKDKVTITPEQFIQAKKKEHNKSKKMFLITWAQNTTPVHTGFWNNLLAYADFIDAEILVIPGRYHNLTSPYENKDKYDSKEWWDERVTKYLTLNRHDLNNNISVLSDVKIQPTASTPLLGLEGMTGEHSSVIGHPRLELKVIPVIDSNKPKITFTTGACTLENYSDSKAGKKGEFNHSIGFAIVEIKDDNTFFFRQVSANNKGNFIDLFYYVKDGTITREENIEAIAMGDIHVANCDPNVSDATFNHLFKRLYPKKIFIHDIIDSKSISHHNLKDPFIQHQQELDGSNSLEAEISEMIDWLKQIKDYNVYIVKSNHDEHIDTFLKTTDWRKMSTFKNAIPYMEYATATLKGEAPNGIVPYVINKAYPNFTCLTHNDNLLVKGWLMSVHGHIGASGSRGSLQQYSKLSTKILVGHSHVAGRVGGAASVGTSTVLRVGYNIGPSAWINSHGIINKLGKLQHIVFFNTENGLEYTTLN